MAADCAQDKKRPGYRGVKVRCLVLVAGLARSPGFGFVDAQRATTKAEVVKSFNGGIGFAVFHFHKAKATGTAGIPVDKEFHGQNADVLGKKILNLFFSSGPGKVPDINGLGHETPSQKKQSSRAPIQ